MDIQRRRERQRQYQAAYYQKNKQKHIAAVRKREAELHAWWRDYKAGLACEHCGESRPACLDFHHVSKTETEHDPGNLLHRAGWGRERILQELRHCVVLCANCHRALHAEHRQ